ncbi:glycoside hydrolase family 16 protein [Aulographum hederae CBS 113979]|uniref:Glycoside hydrolase family 16 protein n=1 Tax=Aulographum hederae CBS 113979 TaxID=1176131 RepID=A0A6G1H4V6_9PEZI|nr:glycoside hydrolase family 16 protein [Aulographum hederae CBS 113979]
MLSKFLPLAGVALFSATTLTNSYTGAQLFNDWDFFSARDSTHGAVAYLPRDQALSSSLAFVPPSSPSAAIFGADSKTAVAPGSGRPSVRLTTKQGWTHGLFVADIAHMPTGCGVWPSWWMFGADWPNNGEVDIVEGVHEQRGNIASLHTSAGCTIRTGPGLGERAAEYSGRVRSTNCAFDPVTNTNTGCGIEDVAPGTASYGAEFNRRGGGVYVLEWTDAEISVWHLQCDSPQSRLLMSSAAVPSTKAFGVPLARFGAPENGARDGGDQCDIASKFHDMKMVFTTTFCGDWAGDTWEGSGCKAKTGVETCEAFVEQNPQMFREAFWDVRGVRVFQAGAAAPLAVPRAMEEANQPEPLMSFVPREAKVERDAPEEDVTSTTIVTVHSTRTQTLTETSTRPLPTPTSATLGIRPGKIINAPSESGAKRLSAKESYVGRILRALRQLDWEELARGSVLRLVVMEEV